MAINKQYFKLIFNWEKENLYEKKERVKIKNNIKKFSNDFFYNVSSNIELLNEFSMQVSSVFPNVFLNDEIGTECYYSTDRKHIFIIFDTNSKKNHLNL